MNQTQRKLYYSPSFFSSPLTHLQQLWTLVIADYQTIGISFQRACLMATFTIELLHQARSISPENKHQRDQIGRFLQWYPHISTKTQGGYLNHLLCQSIVSELMMTGGNTNQFQKLSQTKITFMLSEWLQSMKLLKKFKQDKTQTDLWGVLKIFLSKPIYDNIYDKLLFIQFIKGDLVSLENQWLTLTDKQLQHPQSVSSFLTLVLPKVLFNVLVQAEYFSKSMIENNPKQVYDILYLNENKHTQLIKRTQFFQLITTLLQNLINQVHRLNEIQQSEVLNIVINYFYAYHVQHFENCSQFLINFLAKLSSVVRFAKFREIMLLLTVLQKLKYTPFIKQLYEKYPWILESKQKIQSSPANPRNAVDIFLSQEKSLMVMASQKIVQLVQVFRPYSLVYFDISCKNADIDVNFFYAGNFDESTEFKKLIFQKKRLRVKQDFKGSIEAVQPGLYYLQFDNSYSWMTAKTVGYKLQLIVPMDISNPFGSSPYTRFLTGQYQFKIPSQMSIDYDFFQSKDPNFASGSYCDIKVHKNTYIATIGGNTYQLQSQNPQSALQKLSFKLQQFFQKYKSMNYLLNGKPHRQCTVQDIMKSLKSQLQNQNNDIPSPVEMLNDIQSNRQSLDSMADKKLSIIQQQRNSKDASQIKNQQKQIQQIPKQKIQENPKVLSDDIKQTTQQQKTESLKQKEEEATQQGQTKQPQSKKEYESQQNSYEQPKEIQQQTLD